jgi:hypothetical protein
MKLASWKMNRKAISMILSAGLLVGSLIPAVYTDTAAASAAKQAITLKVNGAEHTLESKPFLTKGRVYIPLREISNVLQAVVVWQNESKQATLTLPEQTVVLTLGQTAATRNGTAIKLSDKPIMQNSRVYVPLRTVTESLGADVEWKAETQEVEITQKADLAMVWGVNSVYWLNWDNGNIYESYPYESTPKFVGTMDIELKGFHSVRLAAAVNAKQLIVEDHYGEPMINTELYSAMIVKGAIVKQTKVHYWQRYTANVTQYGDHQVMTDGKNLFLLDSTGQVTKQYDLVALIGLDENYSIEGIGEAYALVRPNRTGLLTLLNLETSEIIHPYKKLNAQEQEYAETNEVPYYGDNIKFEGEGDGVLKFSYRSIFDNKDHAFTVDRPAK